MSGVSLFLRVQRIGDSLAVRESRSAPSKPKKPSVTLRSLSSLRTRFSFLDAEDEDRRIGRRSGASRMLGDWLRWLLRNTRPVYTRFSVVDINEAVPLTDGVRSHLRQLLLTARFRIDFLRDAAMRLGWARTSQRILRGLGMRDSARRGLFGEAITAAMLAEFHQYTIPVQKLQVLVSGEQTQPGTDVIALKVGAAGAIDEVCYVESKLRTYNDTNIAREGYAQLLGDYTSAAVDMLWFVAERMHERGDPLYEPFMQYFWDRADTRQKDVFRLFLIWEDRVWTETVLQNLEDEEPVLERFNVHVTRLRELAVLTAGLLHEIGIQDIIED